MDRDFPSNGVGPDFDNTIVYVHTYNMGDLSSTAMMSPLEHGRRKYQQKEYQAALAPFTEAVNMSTGHLLLTALDHRAAAYEKLRQFKPALKDAKRMIETKPEISKGYLRCGKILELKGEDELAFKIYERGLKKVKIGTDNDRTLLQTMFNKMKRSQNPSKSLDPLQYLPLELAEMICHNLSMRDRVICLAVSKPWKRLLESSPKLWTTLDTTCAKRIVSLSSLRAYLKRSNYTLDTAIISKGLIINKSTVLYLTKNCKKLRYLEVRGNSMIGASLISSLPFAENLESIVLSKHTIIGVSSAQDVLKSCRKTLREVRFLSVKGSRMAGTGSWPILPRIQSLCLKAEGNFLLDMPELVKATVAVESVTLNGWKLRNLHGISEWTNLQDLDLGNTDLTMLPNLPRTLRRLIIRDNRHLSGFSINEDESLSLPLLETFDCAATNLASSWVSKILSASVKYGNLRVLSIGHRLIYEHGVNDLAMWAEMFPPSQSLEELSIAASGLSEVRLLEVVEKYPNLQVLDVSFTKITGVAVKQFVKSGIKYLKINECGEMGSDAVDWARGQGVKVDFNFSSQPTRGFRDAFA